MARSLTNRRTIRRASIDISDIRRRDEMREPSMNRIDVRLENGWNGEDSGKMVREERVHTEWLMPDARLAGICMGSTWGGVKWGRKMAQAIAQMMLNTG